MCSVLNLNYSSIKLLKFCGWLERRSGTRHFVGTKKGVGLFFGGVKLVEALQGRSSLLSGER